MGKKQDICSFVSSGEVVKTLGNDVPDICFVIYLLHLLWLVG